MASVGFGQNPGFAKSPIKFRSTEWVGLSTGMAGSAGEIQTVNGVSKGPWFLGAGAGIDYYRFRSVPLFGSVTRDISLGKTDWLFLYIDGGINVPWYTRKVAPNPTGYDEILGSTFHAGEYWSGGLGYLWKLGDHSKKAVSISAGYTVKKLSEDQRVPTTCMSLNCDMVHYEYLNRMYMFLVGFRF
jgi:hypothetical protein